ncbi:MAG TPA: iron-containing redox enzyme family protein, partial [Acidimicrobiales bacterium]
MADAPSLPVPRGPISEHVLRSLADPPSSSRARWAASLPSTVHPLADDDLHLALYCLYELHYRGLPGVDPMWEWDPRVLELRARLEARFEAALREAVGPVLPDVDVRAALVAESEGDGPSLSSWMEHQGTVDAMREFCVHRSLYQLKEADPHTWGIPRLQGRPKAALVAIQADEYGGGDEPSMHSTLFADTMAALGLDTRYGAYLDAVPGETLATVNLVTMFGLHRRWRGALVGHLALFEMTSRGPMAR